MSRSLILCFTTMQPLVMLQRMLIEIYNQYNYHMRIFSINED